MNISDGEKLILLMLSELYEQLHIEGETDPQFIKSAIFSQNLWGIPWKYPGIPFERQETPPIVEEVLDILVMWSSIEYAYQELTDEEKRQVEEEAQPFGKNPRFQGFDGNNESEFMNVASFLINDLERFQEFKGRSLNAHMPTLDTHRRMLSAFENTRDESTHGPMSLGRLITLLKEKIHPENRNAPNK